jgi:hypothetical protein
MDAVFPFDKAAVLRDSVMDKEADQKLKNLCSIWMHVKVILICSS